MAGYQPKHISGNSAGLIQSREEFILPEDAYPQLINAYVWRERIKRKQSFKIIGRLSRTFTNQNRGFASSESLLTISGYVVGMTTGSNAIITTAYAHNLTASGTLVLTGIQGLSGANGIAASFSVVDATHLQTTLTTLGTFTAGTQGFFWTNTSLFTQEPNATIEPGSVIITYFTSTNVIFTDNGLGILIASDPSYSGTINYINGIFSVNSSLANNLFAVTITYFPGIPVMGVRTKDNQSALVDTTVFFDEVYAYIYNGVVGQFQEYLPGTTWTGSNDEFFWTTNYWVDSIGIKIFWATNNSISGDPIRYTNGVTGTNWINFNPQLDNAPNFLWQCLALLPFRGRMVTFNTFEGLTLNQSQRYSNRIRWSAIGTPFSVTSSIVSATNPKAWRDDIRGQGGFLDIPTNEDIVSVGFVRDNLVIFCENSTWQLRYTGRSIAPFQIEKVNSEIGSAGTFSSIQFDTSLLCIGTRGIVECDSFQSRLIDIKIPDFVFDQLNNNQNGQARIQGIRDFVNRLAYWTFNSTTNLNGTFPNSRLVYNYENESWAIFTDSLTTLGIFQLTESPTWLDINKPWIECNFPWIFENTEEPVIVGGNQQGFIEQLDIYTTNDPSLFISAITANITTSTALTSPNHNLITGNVIMVSGIPTGTPFANLNGMVFGVNIPDVNTILLNVYYPDSGQFNLPQLDDQTGYIGGGLISVRDNFSVVSKKFNFMEEGQSIQMGYLDILLDASELSNPGAISMNIYVDYNDDTPTNTLENNTKSTQLAQPIPDGFFNQIIPTSSSFLNTKGGSKFWQRVICPTRGNFITIEYTFNNAQMAGKEQTLDVQIDAQVLWMRRAGRMTQI